MLGGLILRYALGKLFSDQTLLEHFEPCVRPQSRPLTFCAFHLSVPVVYFTQTFYSFASPHLGGIRPLESGFVNAVANFVMDNVLDKTGKQLLLDDHHEVYEQPLLVAMADPSASSLFLN
jgi:hypothetical protein